MEDRWYAAIDLKSFYASVECVERGLDPLDTLLVVMELQRKDPQRIEMGFDMYLGPNHYQTLQSFDQKYEKIIPLGGWLVGWFTRFVIIPMFNFFHRFIGSYGLIILLMTLVIKLVVDDALRVLVLRIEFGLCAKAHALTEVLQLA